MYLLDTDHLSILERGGGESEHLLSRLAATRPGETAVTIITYEEQTRGWFSYLAKARSLEAQTRAYGRLAKHLATFCSIPVVPFGEEAARELQNLRGAAAAGRHDGLENRRHSHSQRRDTFDEKPFRF